MHCIYVKLHARCEELIAPRQTVTPQQRLYRSPPLLPGPGSALHRREGPGG